MAEIEDAMEEQQSPELQQEEPNELHKISEQYSHIPPSPDANTLLPFAHGNLGDIMAAEFGELSVRNSPSENYITDTSLQNREGKNSSFNGHPREQEQEQEQAIARIQEIQPVDDALVPVDGAAADLAPIKADITASSSSTASTVEVEQQSLGPSMLGGDMLYNAVAFGDGEGHSRQRILAFAAKRCANAVQKNPLDYDSLYNWALVLQESADSIGGDVPGAGKDQLLEEACLKYEAATNLCPTLHEAFYNWAIAISDRAKARGRTKEAEELWKQACKRYERAVQLNRNSPQALNNWGLALQELSGIVSIKDKRSIIKTAIKKFRAAISLQFDFHRAIYNLGTVLYGLAEDTIRTGNQPAGHKELTASELYSQSAIYVAAAHALKPDYPVYRSALRLVRSKLPLAYLKTGYLSVAADGRALAPHSDWKRMWFVLDHEAFYQVDKSSVGLSPKKTREGSLSSNGLQMNGSHDFRIEIAHICGLSQCADLSLPPGPAFCVDTTGGQHYLIAETWEEVYCWVDAIRLVYTIYLRGQCDVLGGVIAG